MNLDFMKQAIEIARHSDCDVPVGCVIVKDDKIISCGTNEREKTNKISSHAEIKAIEDAEKKLGTWKLVDCEMYVTLEPCPMCAGAIVQSKIKKIYFGAYDSIYGAFGSKINMCEIMNSKTPKFFGGIMEVECSDIIKIFFETIRKND